MKKIIQFTFASLVCLGQAVPVPAPAPAAQVTLPAVDLSGISLVVAGGASSTPPRHAAMALGIIKKISPTEDFFMTLMLAPSQVNNTEQASILLGMTQNLGTIIVNNVTMRTWISAAWGTTLANYSQINYAASPTAIVATASTNPLFTSQYVFGFGFAPKWCKTCEWGMAEKYVQTKDQPKQVVIGPYLKWDFK